MNISHAGAIILYEIFKNVYEYGVDGLEEMTLIEKDYLLKEMEEIINTLDIPARTEIYGCTLASEKS